MDDWIEPNRASRDERAEPNTASADSAIDRFLADPAFLADVVRVLEPRPRGGRLRPPRRRHAAHDAPGAPLRPVGGAAGPHDAGDDGEWQLTDGEDLRPLSYTLRAVKEG